MKTMAAGQFKAQCLQVMEKVRKTRMPVLITKRGKPVAKLVPVEVEGPKGDPFGCLAGRIEIVGDIVGPILPAEEWEMLK